ncbi:unnamed protein product [Caenorhabditis bovis]|uniref:NR LBD domain-containing protein n=1 Tax=Caenorhabditis bovis TaxID=2654633 RepID=A0A8S1F0N0_9PELO|nr:unnamed protein product [Caenorhabditis bovis]
MEVENLNRLTSFDENEAKIDEKTMRIISSHSLKVSSENGYRFVSDSLGFSLFDESDLQPIKQFGYVFHGSLKLESPTEILRKLIPLEKYCYAIDSNISITCKENVYDVDLFEALFFPLKLSPRTAIHLNNMYPMSPKTIKSMWCRLVAYYFELIAGIPELRLLGEADKLKLIVSQLCNVICFHIVYMNSKDSKEFTENVCLQFGFGYYWSPNCTDDTLVNFYCENIWMAINSHVIPILKHIKITFEEYLLAKMVVLFKCSEISRISPEGLEYIRSVENKYRIMLATHIQSKYFEDESLSGEEKTEKSTERLQAIMRIITGVDIIGELDDKSLTSMVEINHGAMRGTLQRQIHSSLKKRNHN